MPPSPRPRPVNSTVTTGSGGGLNSKPGYDTPRRSPSTVRPAERRVGTSSVSQRMSLRAGIPKPMAGETARIDVTVLGGSTHRGGNPKGE